MATRFTADGLADVLAATVDDVDHAVWVLAANGTDDSPRWSGLAEQLRLDGAANFTQNDLREIRSQLNAMTCRPPSSTTGDEEPAAGHAAPSMKALLHAAVGGRDLAQPRPHEILWEDGSGGCKIYRCAPAATYGERVLVAELGRLSRGLVILNPVIPLRKGAHEVDAIVLTPKGVVTVEQKDIPQGGGVLSLPLNAPPECDGVQVEHLQNARRQARLHAQRLASLMKEGEPAVDVGYIHSVLSVHGAAQVEGPRSDVWPSTTDNVLYTVTECLLDGNFTLPASAVREVIDRLGVASWPDDEILAQGFPGA